MLTYVAARDTLVAQLRSDARAHRAGQLDEIGRRFDRVEHQVPTGTAPELAKLHVALAFWDGWIDAHPNLTERVQTLALRLRHRDPVFR